MARKNHGAGLLAVIVAMAVLAVSVTYSIWQVFPMFQQAQQRSATTFSHQLSADAVLDYLITVLRNRKCLNSSLEILESCDGNPFIDINAFITGQTSAIFKRIDLTPLINKQEGFLAGFFPKTPGVPDAKALRIKITRTGKYDASYTANLDEIYARIEIQVEAQKAAFGAQYFNAIARVGFFSRSLSSMTLITPKDINLNTNCPDSPTSNYGDSATTAKNIAQPLCLGRGTYSAADNPGIVFHSPVLTGGNIKVQNATGIAPVYFEDTVFVGPHKSLQLAKKALPFKLQGLTPQDLGFLGLGNGLAQDMKADQGLAKIFDLSTNRIKADTSFIYACLQRIIYSPVFSVLLMQRPWLAKNTVRQAYEGAGRTIPVALTNGVKDKINIPPAPHAIESFGEDIKHDLTRVLALSDRNYFSGQVYIDESSLAQTKYYYLPDPEVDVGGFTWKGAPPTLKKKDNNHGAILDLYLGEVEHLSTQEDQFDKNYCTAHPDECKDFATAYPYYPWKDSHYATRVVQREEPSGERSLNLSRFYDAQGLGAKKFPYLMKASLGHGDEVTITFKRDNRTIYELLKKKEQELNDRWNQKWNSRPTSGVVQNPFPANYELNDGGTKTWPEREQNVLNTAANVIQHFCSFLQADLPADNGLPSYRTYLPGGNPIYGLNLSFTAAQNKFARSFVCDGVGIATNKQMTPDEKVPQEHSATNNPAIPLFSTDGIDDLKKACETRDLFTNNNSDQYNNDFCNKAIKNTNCFPFNAAIPYVTPGPDFTAVPDISHFANHEYFKRDACPTSTMPRCLCKDSYDQVDSPDKFSPRYPNDAYSDYNVLIRKKYCGLFSCANLGFDESNLLICVRNGLGKKEENEAIAYRSLCLAAVNSLESFIKDINQYRILQYRFHQKDKPQLTITLGQIDNVYAGSLTRQPGLPRSDLAMLSFKIKNPLFMPHKVSFNLEVFDRTATPRKKPGANSYQDLEVKYSSSVGQLNQVFNSWSVGQNGGPNRHFLWNKLTLVKHDQTGEFTVGPATDDEELNNGTRYYKMTEALGPGYKIYDNSDIEKDILKPDFLSPGESFPKYSGVKPEKLFSFDKSYNCFQENDQDYGFAPVPGKKSGWYFLGGMNNGFYLQEQQGKAGGPIPDSASVDILKTKLNLTTSFFPGEVFSSWEDYQIQSKAYLNLVHNRLAREDKAAVFLADNCDPIVKEYGYKDVFYEDLAEGEHKYAVSPDNCHFIPSHDCIGRQIGYSHGDAAEEEELSSGCNSSCPGPGDGAFYDYWRFQYNPYDHLLACTGQADVTSVDLETEQVGLDLIEDYDFSPSTRMSWHNAVADVEIDPARLQGETKRAYLNLAAELAPGESLATKQERFLRRINPESSLNVACQKDYPLAHADHTFETASIIRNCVIARDKDVVAGFFVCDTLTIEPRSSRLDLVGTFIVGNLKIDPSAYKYGVHWYSIFNPLGARILRQHEFLKYTESVSYNPLTGASNVVAQKCPINGRFTTVDYWSLIPDEDEDAGAPKNDDIATQKKYVDECSPATSLATINQNFSWPIVDPYVGYFDLKDTDALGAYACVPPSQPRDLTSMIQYNGRGLNSRISARTFDKDQSKNVVFYGIELERDQTHPTDKELKED